MHSNWKIILRVVGIFIIILALISIIAIQNNNSSLLNSNIQSVIDVILHVLVIVFGISILSGKFQSTEELIVSNYIFTMFLVTMVLFSVSSFWL